MTTNYPCSVNAWTRLGGILLVLLLAQSSSASAPREDSNPGHSIEPEATVYQEPYGVRKSGGSPISFEPREPSTIWLVAFGLFTLYGMTARANYRTRKLPIRANASSGTPARQRLLIVDDDEGIIAMLSLLFARMRYETHALVDSTKVMQWLATHPCDALILDLKMPKLDGLSLLHSIRQQFTTLPVVIYTGTPKEDAVSRDLLLAGRDAYVSKTSPIEALCSAVAKVPVCK